MKSGGIWLPRIWLIKVKARWPGWHFFLCPLRKKVLIYLIPVTSLKKSQPGWRDPQPPRLIPEKKERPSWCLTASCGKTASSKPFLGFQWEGQNQEHFLIKTLLKVIDSSASLQHCLPLCFQHLSLFWTWYLIRRYNRSVGLLHSTDWGVRWGMGGQLEIFFTQCTILQCRAVFLVLI